MSDVKNDIQDFGYVIKSSVNVATGNIKDPDRDLEMEYKNKEMNEEKTLALEESEETTMARTTTKEVGRLAPSFIPRYKKILVPDDFSELSDTALSHAIYISNSTGADLVILNIITDTEIKPTTISAITKEEVGEGKEGIIEVGIVENKVDKHDDIHVSLEGQAEQMVKERVRLCKESGAKNQISYKMQTGKNVVDEILGLSEEMDIDLIVMSSSKVTATIRGLTSTTRKVIDSAKRPVLVIYEE
ncbi:MAG: universal stress protein [Nitrososphaeraceae archaeon]